MANFEVIMPKMGESINEGTLIKWHKQKGDKVEKDEIILMNDSAEKLIEVKKYKK